MKFTGYDCVLQPWKHGKIKKYSDLYEQNPKYKRDQFFKFLIHDLHNEQVNSAALLFNLYDRSKGEEKKFYAKKFNEIFEKDVREMKFNKVLKLKPKKKVDINNLCEQRRKVL